MGMERYRTKDGERITFAPVDPDVPISGHITNLKVQLTCARCGRTCTHDRPQWFSARELKRQRDLREQSLDVRWVQFPETVPGPLEELDMPHCPCGEQYIALADSRGLQLTSVFPKRKAPHVPGTAAEAT